METFLQSALEKSTEIGIAFGAKLLGALALWIVGRWLIRMASRLLGRVLQSRALDSTVSGYAQSAMRVILNVALIVAILGFFGVETTTMAAVIAAAGVAIGMAWSGLLANLAAGIFMIVLRPFKVGDFISAGDVLGTVEDIGLFVTTIDTMDNVRTIVGNNKVFSGNIQNFSTNEVRRVDLVAQLDHSAKVPEVVAALRAELAKIPHVAVSPAPDVEILEFTLAGPKLAVRPYVNNKHYWQVYFDTNRVIRECTASLSVPHTHHHLQTQNATGLSA